MSHLRRRWARHLHRDGVAHQNPVCAHEGGLVHWRGSRQKLAGRFELILANEDFSPSSGAAHALNRDIGWAIATLDSVLA
jgi:hypothetical protein